MKLIIVESPTKAKTLGKFLGDGVSVEATMGHIKDLPKSKISVDVEKNFEPDYLLVEAKLKNIIEVKKQAIKADEIYLATDPDREGEAIAQHIFEYLSEDGKKNIDKNKIKRIVFHEITKSAVENALSDQRKVNRNLVNAQIGRRVLDRLVGYKLSPMLWKKVRRGLSAGRVQSVAVRLIVEKEAEIKAFKPDEYWEIVCRVKKEKEFDIQLSKVDDKGAIVKDKKTADKIVSGLESAKYAVSRVASKEVRKNPYPPYTTSTLTQAASIYFGWSAKRTMTIAQKLYEKGYITYHRTDSFNVSKSAVTSARTFIEGEYGKDYLPDTPRAYKTKSKSAQEAHEAIRPTKIKRIPADVDHQKDAKKLYELIWNRFIASQMNQSVYDQTSIDVKASNYLLKASGSVMKFDGWRRVFKQRNKKEEVLLPKLTEGDALSLIKVNPLQKFTLPPARFNEASLIKTLEKLGIGRPSTYAPIISTIQDRQYVEKKEKRFYTTPVGVAVTGFLLSNFPTVLDYQFTAEMENDLDRVAKGKREWREMMAEFYKPFDKKLISVEKNAKRVKIETEKLGKKCPDCKDGELVIRVGRFGKFVSCSKFPDCKHTDKYEERIGMKCPDCKKGHVIVKLTRRRRKFFGCSTYPKCKFASWKKPGEEKEAK